MNQNSLQVAIALLVYVAIVVAHIVGFGALQFALYTAFVLSAGLVLAISLHSPEHAEVGSHNTGFPSIADSRHQLRVLQNELNEIQLQISHGGVPLNNNRKFDS